MPIAISTEQVLALAPDSTAASAGKKLGSTKHWKSLGQGQGALWGECQGSALYQVRVDTTTFSGRCSCPSRKLPCKHTLGLLLIAATSADAVPQAEPPEWVASWLAKRGAAAAPAKAKESAKSPEQVAAEQAKRAAKRMRLVADGLDGLDLWMADLIRNGLSGVETQGASFWEGQAARLVDAQAPGVAAQLRRMAAIPGSRSDWPDRLLGEMGKLALLTHAFRRLEALDPALREDVRQLVGWNLAQEEVAQHGEHVAGEWIVLGQWIDDSEPRLRAQRTWLAAATSGRPALILQFSAMNQPFPETYIPGTRLTAELHFWPGAYPLRARVAERRGEPAAHAGPLPGVEAVATYLASVADALAHQPWLDRFPCVLRDVIPGCAPRGAEWHVRDGAGHALPLAGADHWRLLALSGGHPVDLAGEWDGEALLPLGVVTEGAYAPLWGVD
jgi:hypothetical protein